MKRNVLVLLGTVALVFAFSSCNKERECVCKTYVNDIQTTSSTITIDEGKCKDHNSSVTILGVTTEVKCTNN
ncbi:MAG: hypothetical protein PHU62_09435 [Bacteroidales bacterium]|jgi:hypothetical protein|nr:hypothetical protein [Bacteroidales bacterium]MDD3152746.1 hypothetical protein [Bacteroidales bacterium]MDD3914919.1 hypothetical protein [Bacteroidales bacterium]MDD4634771.1 hypothetical protein [Bacteroidales bacterium]